MFLDELSLRAADVVALVGFVLIGSAAFWKIMGKLKHLDERDKIAAERARLADERAKLVDFEIQGLKAAAHQQAMSTVVLETKLDGIKEGVDMIYKKLDQR